MPVDDNNPSEGNVPGSLLADAQPSSLDRTYIDVSSPIESPNTPELISAYAGGVSTAVASSSTLDGTLSGQLSYNSLPTHSNSYQFTSQPSYPYGSYSPYHYDSFSHQQKQSYHHSQNTVVNGFPVFSQVDPNHRSADLPRPSFPFPMKTPVPSLESQSYSNSNVTERVVHDSPAAPVPSIVDTNTNTSEEAEDKKKKFINYYEDVLNDGFQWRKYGQKFSKNSPYPTCYYKCAYPNCTVKRQIQRESDGQKVVSLYRGKHNHDQPKVVRKTVNNQQEFTSVIEQFCFSEDSDVRVRLMTKSTSYADHKLILEVDPSVNISSDGCSWKKYGQKQVKGVSVMRSYYKCAVSHCAAKKLVQKASEEGGKSLVTYEHLHCHGANASTTSLGPRHAGDEGMPWKRPNLDNQNPFTSAIHSTQLANLPLGAVFSDVNKQLYTVTQLPTGQKAILPVVHIPHFHGFNASISAQHNVSLNDNIQGYSGAVSVKSEPQYEPEVGFGYVAGTTFDTK
ncbi:hypothetical protein P9112_000971 [Eukaryota sp. TZLM1-RC]